MMRRLGFAIASLLALSACGGSQPPAASNAGATSAAEAQPAEPAAAEAEGEPGGAAEAKPAEPEPAPAADTAPREVRYIQSPEGLKVEVSGVRFFVSATSTKVGGGFGVKISVKGESMDGKSHSLLSTDNGPIAFAGTVTRKKQATSFGDERKGEGEQTITAAAPLEFSREWPGKGGQPLANNDSVELEVGLWGVGENAESRRPLRAFAKVKGKVEGYKGKATVEPPPVGGK
jgi:hypothetical protein